MLNSEFLGNPKTDKVIFRGSLKRKTFYIGLPLLGGCLIFEISPTTLRVEY